jgi:regulator of protease activity HflC (stomatin/prohibitin superfamily)
MFISDPVSYLFKNADPRGSLAANVSNSTVRCLSNLKLAAMLENRHAMSQTVRDEVSPKSHEWGYQLGSIYIRKVHFRDTDMIKQIEEKVVNRLRQVTSAIKQDGANQVSIIASTAERQAAFEFAKAAAMAPASRKLPATRTFSTPCSIFSRPKKSSKAKPTSPSFQAATICSSSWLRQSVPSQNPSWSGSRQGRDLPPLCPV